MCPNLNLLLFEAAVERVFDRKIAEDASAIFYYLWLHQGLSLTDEALLLGFAYIVSKQVPAADAGLKVAVHFGSFLRRTKGFGGRSTHIQRYLYRR